MRLIVDRSTRRRGIAVQDHGHPFLKTAGMTVAGVCAGMVTVYLMDPERGRARRAKLREQVHPRRTGDERHVPRHVESRPRHGNGRPGPDHRPVG